MGHSFYVAYEHIVYGTKKRVAFFDSDIKHEIFRYLATAVRSEGCEAIEVGGHRNHVHLLVRKDKKILTMNLVKEIKRTSSIWLKTKGPDLSEFAWQEGYGAFSVSFSNTGRVRAYIRDQDKHHEKRSWEDEFRHLLRRHGVQYDERYLWD